MQYYSDALHEDAVSSCLSRSDTQHSINMQKPLWNEKRNYQFKKTYKINKEKAIYKWVSIAYWIENTPHYMMVLANFRNQLLWTTDAPS